MDPQDAIVIGYALLSRYVPRRLQSLGLYRSYAHSAVIFVIRDRWASHMPVTKGMLKRPTYRVPTISGPGG
jgi:hypothetical protein